MLQATDVWFAYRSEPVLRGVSAGIDRGGLIGVLGPNGSGKTTLLRLLAGTLRPSRGRVTIDGATLHEQPRGRVARHIAVVPQETHLAFDYTVLEIALMGRYPHLGPFELEGPTDLAVAREALEATGTAHLARRPFATLSGGEKQRVIIASALAQFGPLRPPAGGDAAAFRVLLLDEPTASLDLAYQLEIASLVEQLNRERGLAVVVSTHDLNLAAGLCRGLILLRDGEVIAAGSTQAVLTSENVGRVYDVDADVQYHAGAGRLTLVPLGRRPMKLNRTGVDRD